MGIFERIEDSKLSVAKVTFGAEPKDYEVQEYIQKCYFSLKFSPVVETVVNDIKRNPKRMQREAKKQMLEIGIGTKSQQALKLQQEQNKQERKEKSRKRKEAEEQRMFEMKQRNKAFGGVSMKKKVLAIMLVAVSIMLISACGKKEKLYEIPDLSQYKTDYVGDSSNVINIVSGQEYPEGYSYDSIEIQSETEPYGLTVFLKDEPSAVKLEDELQVNADMTFDLIGNLGIIDYKTADSKEIIASYER